LNVERDSNLLLYPLGDTGAEPEMYDAVDDAELDWSSY